MVDGPWEPGLERRQRASRLVEEHHRGRPRAQPCGLRPSAHGCATRYALGGDGEGTLGRHGPTACRASPRRHRPRELDLEGRHPTGGGVEEAEPHERLGAQCRLGRGQIGVDDRLVDQQRPSGSTSTPAMPQAAWAIMPSIGDRCGNDEQPVAGAGGRARTRRPRGDRRGGGCQCRSPDRSGKTSLMPFLPDGSARIARSSSLIPHSATPAAWNSQRSRHHRQISRP